MLAAAISSGPSMVVFFFSLMLPLTASRSQRRSWQSALLLVFLSELSCDNSVSATAGLSNLGINYGMVADNLPPPSQVVQLLQSISVTRTRIYSANMSALTAFANSGISVIVGIGDEDVASLTDRYYAANWVQTNIAYHYPATHISGILVGNEVFTGNNSQLMNDLLPAMQNLYSALKSLGLDDVFVSTAHSQAILSTSFPPSMGAFSANIASTYLSPVLKFLRNTGAPFMINPYPYFAYKANPQTVSLQYALSATPAYATEQQTSVAALTASVSVTDPNTGLIYYNLLDAEVDAVYAALQALGYNDIEVIVSETGWPSEGDTDEAGANLQNAQAYNSNLIARLQRGQGTPAKPSVPLQAFIFALFNEDLKPGPTSERHYGLFYPNMNPVYNFGLLSSTNSSVNPYATYYHMSSSPIRPPHLVITFVMAAFMIKCLLISDFLL